MKFTFFSKREESISEKIAAAKATAFESQYR
jgi:hypothetical protein